MVRALAPLLLDIWNGPTTIKDIYELCKRKVQQSNQNWVTRVLFKVAPSRKSLSKLHRSTPANPPNGLMADGWWLVFDYDKCIKTRKVAKISQIDTWLKFASSVWKSLTSSCHCKLLLTILVYQQCLWTFSLKIEKDQSFYKLAILFLQWRIQAYRKKVCKILSTSVNGDASFEIKE